MTIKYNKLETVASVATTFFITTATFNATTAQTKTATKTLELWHVGAVVSYNEVMTFGIDNCFTQHNIDNALFKRIYGKSFKHNCTIKRTELRYLHLLHYTIDGHIKLGEMICHKDVSDDLISIFRQLFDAKYPIERMKLIDDYNADDVKSMNHNNTTCFNYRVVAGSKKLSNHSMGKAVDINPLYNPYVKRRADGSYKINPETGRKYANRSRNFKYKIDKDDLAYRLFTKHGFRWGGNYRSLKDYQHFEKY